MRNLIARLVRASLTLAILLVLLGCPVGARIGDLTRDPGRYYNKEVAVSGRVVQSFGVLGQGVYEVDDGTGRIWVFSEGYGVPSRDANVRVAGRVIQGAEFMGKSYALALRQTHRRS